MYSWMLLKLDGELLYVLEYNNQLTWPEELIEMIQENFMEGGKLVRWEELVEVLNTDYDSNIEELADLSTYDLKEKIGGK